jgi:outer membrane lipoprotein-sorting protein
MYRPTITTILAAAAMIWATAPAQAESQQEKGRAIAEEMDRRDLGWGDSSTTLTMTLANRQGQSSTRELRVKALEVQDTGKGDKSLVVFDRPRDVAGTAFLSHTKITDPDDQWLFLPALKRVKRISSANKSGPFMGSEFAYEDMVSQEVDKYKYEWLRDEACGGDSCFVIARTPVYENSGYTRQVVWVDSQEYRPIKIDFYDRKESLLKTLVYSDYRRYLDSYWRAGTMEMTNHQTGKSTLLSFAEYKFQTGLAEGDFTSSRLKRAR